MMLAHSYCRNSTGLLMWSIIRNTRIQEKWGIFMKKKKKNIVPLLPPLFLLSEKGFRNNWASPVANKNFMSKQSVKERCYLRYFYWISVVCNIEVIVYIFKDLALGLKIPAYRIPECAYVCLQVFGYVIQSNQLKILNYWLSQEDCFCLYLFKIV